MKKVALFVLLFLIFVPQTQALYDPIVRSNNIHGIHILFPSELDEASNLVNSENGEWGYVTIPIQSTDRDLEKWQDFLDMCKEKKLIPIIRLATQPHYGDTSVWSKPTESNIIDFANFLNSLDWPVENRYVIIYNEVNRFDEWGGDPPNPERYAELLSFASDVFKRRHNDFYIIMAGLDNAAPNDRIRHMDNMAYIREIIEADPDVFRNIDGFSSHSYPNPGFSQPPDASSEMGTATYKHEYDLINSVTDKKVPAFITETGWVSDNLSSSTIAEYYKTAYEEIWEQDKDKIVAITPFLLNSTGGQFENFSFIINGEKTESYESARGLDKTKGNPIENEEKKDKIAESVDRVKKSFGEFLDRTGLAQNLVTEYIRIFF